MTVYVFDSFIRGPLRFSGDGRLRGSVTANSVPYVRRVHVYAELDRLKGNLRPTPTVYVTSVAPSAETGAWEVKAIDRSLSYTVDSYDRAGVYDPVRKGGLIPETM